MVNETVISLLVGALSTITAFILGFRKQGQHAYHQFVIDNESFRKEVLALVEVEKKNNSELSTRVAMLEKQIQELKDLNHQQSLKSIQDAAENSRLMLLAEKYKSEIESNRLHIDMQNQKIVDLEKKSQEITDKYKIMETKLQECLEQQRPK